MEKPDSTRGREQGDWSAPKPEWLAQPTWWPAALALGVTLLAWGVVTSFIIVILGAAVFAVSLAGWICEIRREQEHAAEGADCSRNKPQD
jgi:hypothetical protein